MSKQFKKENAFFMDYIEKKDEIASHILRYGRIKDFKKVLADAIQVIKDTPNAMNNRGKHVDISQDVYLSGINKTVFLKISISWGISKVALKINDSIVLKTEHNLGGVAWVGNQTKAEYEMYNKVIANGNQAIIENVIPVIWYFESKNVSICPACEKVGDEGFNESERSLVYDVKRVLDKAGLSDLHLGNFGIINGKAVCIDYSLQD